MIQSGYAGKILRVDLSTGNITRVPAAPYAERFIGGRGLAAKIYWDEVPPDTKALDAANRLIFATGPLAGFTGLAGSRLEICGKSPATTPEFFCYSTLGGSWGPELKFAGYDGLVVQGKADKPVYLFLDNDVAEIRDATALRGKDSVATRELLKKELGSTVKVLSAGIAGENLVPFATILAEDDASAASGFAAVMGAKKLKAIVVRGDGKVAAAKPERLRELTDYIRNLAKDRRVTPPPVTAPDVPVKNRRKACYGCIAGCLRGEYEASNGDKGKFMCQQSGSYIGASMQFYHEMTEVPFLAARLCDKYGLDTMVIEPMTTWLNRCAQAGILNEEKTSIPLSKYGSLEFIETLVRKISLREGFGAVLARGIIKAAAEIGPGAVELIGDLILPKTGEDYIYDPRMFITHGIFYAMEPKRPIQHLHEVSWLVAQWVAWHNGAENAYVSSDVVLEVARRFWGSEAAADFSTYAGKALAARKIQDRQYVKECLVLCDFAWPIAHVKYSADHLGDSSIESKIYSAVTGKDMDEEGLYRMGERVFNLQRAILAREGHRGKEYDTLPDFSFTMPLDGCHYGPMPDPDCLVPGPGGQAISHKGAVVDREKFSTMRDEYYGYRGWDVTTGLQKIAKLRELDLDDIAADLAKRGLAV